MRIGILEPKDFSTQAIEILSSCGDVVVFDGGDLGSFLQPLDALFIRLAFYVDHKFLQNAPNLKWLCSPTTGHTHIDEGALETNGISLLSLRGERNFLDTIRATPEHTLGLVIALLRRYRRAFDEVHSGRWNRDVCKGEEIYGNSIGLIGMGRVGYRLGHYFEALGANISYYDVADTVADPYWSRATNIIELIESSRVIILCASHTNSSSPIIGRKEISALRNRYFINTARGELVDEIALLQAINDNNILGVAIDVISNENDENSLLEWRNLRSDRNVIITPHIAGATFTSMARTELFIAEKLCREISNKPMLR